MYTNIKTRNGKNLKIKALVDFRYIYIEINEQLVKEKRIQTKLINFSYKVFNMDGMKNRKVTKVVVVDSKP